MTLLSPHRVQRKRVKGWKMPPNTVSVTRPGPFGNPFKAEDAVEAGYRDGNAMAAFAFMEWLKGSADFPQHQDRRATIVMRLPELRGKNLACFCPLDRPCHADALIKIANALGEIRNVEPKD